MRTLPDPLTCGTSSLLPLSNVPKALLRSDIWFADGNVVLIAGSVAFKMHRGQLERHSEVFKDLFLVARPWEGVVGSSDKNRIWRGHGEISADGEATNEEGDNLVDGCPTVDIYDCPSDVYHLLVALYDGFYFPERHASDFSALSGVLRLSTKYFIDHLRAQCLARLAHDWPATLAEWDQREATATDSSGQYTPRDTFAHPILAINLALELDIPAVLPSAFYDLSRYAPSKIFSGARPPQPVFASPDPCSLLSGLSENLNAALEEPGERARPPSIHLSHDCLVRTLKGREQAQLYISTFLTRALQHHPSPSCSRSTGGRAAASSAHCIESFYFIHLNVLRSVGGIACGRDADPLFTLMQAAEMLERKDFSDGVKTCGLKMCGVCRREWRGEVGRAREEVWELIPAWFGLKDLDTEEGPEVEEEQGDIIVD